MENKKLILFAPYNLMAHYLRCIELAKYLSNEFEIVFLYSSEHGKYVRHEHFKMTEPFEQSFENVINKTRNFDFTWINYKSVSLVINNLNKIIQKHKPDLVIGDTYLGLKIACSLTKTPFAAIANSYITKQYDGYRPVPHNHRAMQYSSKVSPEMWKKIVRSVEKFTLYKVHRPFRLLRIKHGLKPYFDLFDEFSGDITLLCDDKRFFPLKDLPENFINIGPIVFRSKENENDLINTLKVNSEKPVIFITSGSSGRKIVPELISEELLHDYTVIVSGSKEDKISGKVIYRRFVNFLAISEYVDLYICHAGNGSFYQAIEAGKKILAIPSMFEQEWNAYAFEKAQRCKVVFPEDSEDNILKSISTMLNTQIKFDKRKYNISDLFRNQIKNLLNS
ncbi:MAG TPA: glycosyltransferase [Bacteroidales bacterium]|nr:glycosyltransferase [Bacteroidales bacterium]